MKMMTINFDGEEYPARLIDVSGKRLISIDRLDVALMTKDGCYVSEEARAIDEGIFLYVPEPILVSDEKTLVRYVKEMAA
jgi:hypothetical protein